MTTSPTLATLSSTVATTTVCRRCGRPKKTTAGSNAVHCMTLPDSGSVSSHTSPFARRRHLTSNSSSSAGNSFDCLGHGRRCDASLPLDSSSPDAVHNGDGKQHPTAESVLRRPLWCERCNSRLVALKWRAVRVWLPLARERLQCKELSTSQRQEISRLLGVCIDDVLQLPLLTTDHVIDDEVTCSVCHTATETLRRDVTQMISSLEQTLERTSQLKFDISKQSTTPKTILPALTPLSLFQDCSVSDDFTLDEKMEDHRRTVGIQCSIDGSSQHGEDQHRTEIPGIMHSKAASATGEADVIFMPDGSRFRCVQRRDIDNEERKKKIVKENCEQFEILCQAAIDAAQKAMVLLVSNKMNSEQPEISTNVSDNLVATKTKVIPHSVEFSRSYSLPRSSVYRLAA